MIVSGSLGGLIVSDVLGACRWLTEKTALQEEVMCLHCQFREWARFLQPAMDLACVLFKGDFRVLRSSGWGTDLFILSQLGLCLSVNRIFGPNHI